MKKSSWVKHKGSVCPIKKPRPPVYELKFQCGDTILTIDPWSWNWSNQGTTLSIVSYRLVENYCDNCGKVNEDMLSCGCN